MNKWWGGAKISWAQGRKVPKYGPGCDAVSLMFQRIILPSSSGSSSQE